MQSTLIPTDQSLEELAGEAAQQVGDLWCRRMNGTLDAERLEDLATGIWECFHAALVSDQVISQKAASSHEPALLPCT